MYYIYIYTHTHTHTHTYIYIYIWWVWLQCSLVCEENAGAAEVMTESEDIGARDSRVGSMCGKGQMLTMACECLRDAFYHDIS
jgi:hypothetical protein